MSIATRLALPGITAVCLLGSSTHCLAAEQVPVRFIDGLPVIEVRLGDIKADFVLDTGGQIGITVPPPLINAATRVSLQDERQKRGDAAGNIFFVQSLRASSVRVAQADLGAVSGLVHYKWGLKVGDPDAPEVTRKGAIGLKALESRNALLDLPHGRLALYPRDANDRPAMKGWHRIPFEYDARGIVVTLNVNGVPMTMALDTAATTSMVSKEAGIFNRTRSPCAHKAKDVGFCGMTVLRQIEAEGKSFGPLTVAVVKMAGVPFEGLLGIDFFRAQVVFIDFDAKALFIRDQVARPVDTSR